MTAPVLEFLNAEIIAESKSILGPVSTRIERPGITIIMGPNGAGKSLFLAAAHGLLGLSRGTVTWNDVPATSGRASRGFVFQQTPVLRRSVAGNIAFPLSALKMPRARKKELVSKALNVARLDNDASKPAAALSGGELKRLALARAMVAEPAAILLDEPAANLDPASTAELETSLRHISQSGVKVILSSHSIAQVRRLADDILFFDHGKLVETAQATDFLDQPATLSAQKFLKGEL